MKPEWVLLEQYWHRDPVSICPPHISEWLIWGWNQVSVLRSLNCRSSEIHVVSRANFRHDGLLQVQFSARGTVRQRYQTGADTSLVTQRQFSCDTKYKYLNRDSQLNLKQNQVFLTFWRNEVSLEGYINQWKNVIILDLHSSAQRHIFM